MKSYNHLFEKLISYENLSEAIEKSSLGKRERREVKKVLEHKDEYIKRLQYLLINKKLKIRKHEAVKINDGIISKIRLIIKTRLCLRTDFTSCDCTNPNPNIYAQYVCIFLRVFARPGRLVW